MNDKERGKWYTVVQIHVSVVFAILALFIVSFVLRAMELGRECLKLWG